MDKDVAGARLQYDGVEFITVKGCGHTIPTYCPKQGAAILDMYLPNPSTTGNEEMPLPQHSSLK